MASLGHTCRQSKHLTHLELSTYLSDTFMHWLLHPSSHFMQLMHLSGSISICMRVKLLKHPKAVPIGHISVQKPLPVKSEHIKSNTADTIPATIPVATPTPNLIHSEASADGWKSPQMFRIILHGSIQNGTAATKARIQKI